MKSKLWIGFACAALLAAVAAAPAVAQTKEVTIGYQDMVVPYRIAQEAKDAREGHRLQDQLEAVRRRRRSHQGDGLRRACRSARSGSAGIAAAVSRGEPYELFWILDDIGDAEALVAKNGSGINTHRRPQGQEDRDAVQLHDAFPHDGRARAGEDQSCRRADPQHASARSARRVGSAATSRRRSSGIRCSPK